jgi:hypothetical protein
MSRRPHEPSKESRQLVQLHATIGTPQAVISDILGIDNKTLTKYYREELDQALARAGWREKQEVDLTSSDGSMTPHVIERVIVQAKPDGKE